MNGKLLFLIPDGMGGWPLKELDGQTCLEAAATPAMDALARECAAGTIQTVPEGMAPGSDVANMSLMGFDPAAHHTGRGPIEAAAQGLELNPDDLVFRLNLVDLTTPDADGTMLDYSSGHITTEDSTPLVEDLNTHLRKTLGRDDFTLYPGVQYRHLLVLHGAAKGPEADIYIHPPHDITDQAIADDVAAFGKSPLLRGIFTEAAKRLAETAGHTKVKSVWPWGQGRPLILPDFQETYGIKGAVISAVDLVKGLGRASGMEVIDVPGTTGLLDTNYQGKVDAALEFLRGGGDFCYLHVEAPDECGHSGVAADKVEAIRRFDELITAPVAKALPGAAIFIACDHFTPIAERTHTTDPVPFLLAAPGLTRHGLPAFSETFCAETGLKVDPGHEVLSTVLEILKGLDDPTSGDDQEKEDKDQDKS